jgi:peptidoglycan/LPS O-acetylase OafA/YrhL
MPPAQRWGAGFPGIRWKTRNVVAIHARREDDDTAALTLTPAPQPQHQTRDPNLDLVRALAITFVLVGHFPLTLFPYQRALGFGVDVFFVLSGFLIGRILLKHEQEGLRLGRFWTDRWLRTLPAYYLVLLAGLVSGSVVSHGWPVSAFRGHLWEYFVFLQNYGFLSPRNENAPFPVSWSLCVEEQFYLTLPILFLLVRSLRGRIVALLTAVALAGLVRRVYLDQSTVFFFTTHYRFDGIALGVLAALLCSRRPDWAARLRPLGPFLVVVWLTLIISRCMMARFPLGDFLSFLNPLTALVLVSSAGAKPFPGATSRWSRSTAALSYALYLVHYQVYSFALSFWHSSGLAGRLPRALMWVFVLLSAGVAAWVVHVVAEKPGLALRERIRHRLNARELRPTPSAA